MGETLEDKTVQKTIESLEKQLEAINYHFENAKKELEDLKLLLNQQAGNCKVQPRLEQNECECF